MKFKITFIVLFCCTFCLAQKNNGLRNVLPMLRDYKVEKADSSLKLLNMAQMPELLQWNVQLLRYGLVDTIISPVPENFTAFQKSLQYLKNANAYLSTKIPQDSLAYINFRNSYLEAEKTNDLVLINFANEKLVKYLFYSNRENPQINTIYIDSYKKNANTDSDIATSEFYKLNQQSIIERKPKIDELKQALTIAGKSENKFIQIKLNQLIAVHQSYYLSQIDSSKYYTKKALALCDNKTDAYIDKLLFVLNGNLALDYLDEKEYGLALSYLKIAQKYDVGNNEYLKKAKLYKNLSQIYKGLKIYDSAFYFIEQEKIQLVYLNEYKKALAINETEVKYQTAEKEKQILIEQNKKLINRNIAIALAVGLLLVGFITIFTYKYFKKQQLLSEQLSLIELNEKEKILKDQELNTIDAMLEGQEKERELLAADLHDSVGASLVAAKMQFNHLVAHKHDLQNQDEILEKTNKLLDEAYNEVRNMAHLKNSGVLAKQGLLPALEKLAKNASTSVGLNVVVANFGLEKRLENYTEISIFRIIQETITNIIKHAKATEATISLTQHNEFINIIIEDDGVGFDTKKSNKKGMGLHSIETRIEHSGGSFEVDSSPNNGTTILIDIPI